MVLDDVWSLLEKRIFPIPSVKDGQTPLFNQYNDADPDVDLPNAEIIRRGNLFDYLESFSERPNIAVIGEAPGWRGCRFSGVPFTSEAQLCRGSLPFAGHQSSVSAMLYSESTATIFWDCMLPYHSRFFAWNCVPFHPHKSGQMLSNRTPTENEIAAYRTLLSEILSLIGPKHVVAVGKSAERALGHISVSCSCVRHPSHGGAEGFRRGMRETLNGA
jgi:uracil-DNA glycosylase